ncbi:MAG: anti-sigma factor antagonist [Candidatus Krumholzibacteriota bacterium]|nr:anti-sigma factor antagonist [Candidatus Krumholzibacteriota bacterium]
MRQELLKGRETFHLEIPADENNLSDVRDFISDICVRAGFSKRETNNTKLAMDEACTNIIKHAYGTNPGEVRIDVQAEPGKVEINIFDRGKPFEWSKVKDPDLQRYVEIGKKGGLGIFLMNRLMDDLDYHTGGSGNHLYMVKMADVTGRRVMPLFESIKPTWTATLRFKFALRATLGLLGLVLVLGVTQFLNQSREIDSQCRQAWFSMSNLAKTLESKSENALVLDDLYHPEYRKVSDFILGEMAEQKAVKYIRIVNNERVIVCSNDLDEFLKNYQVPAVMENLSARGKWRSVRDDVHGPVEEFHYPVQLMQEDSGKTAVLGRVVLGVSKSILEGNIADGRFRTILILLGVFVVGVALIYFLISVFVKPIQALTDGVRAIGEGSLEDGIQIDGPEEIGAIARAFNEITMKFRDAQKSVVEQERMQKEMQVAQEIQHSLLPSKVPQVSGYDIASLYRAAKEVGGDYYDFVNVDEDSLGVVVADVSGKGVPGSLVMTMIRTALRMEARGSLSAADVMSRMNDFVTEDMKKGMFVTIFYVILDSKNRIISYASAGHNPMILFRAETDETFFLNPRGFPVGISLPDDSLFRRSIDVEKIKLKKDDMLVIYTDGVTEAMNSAREQYGEDRLIRLIKQFGQLKPDQFIERLNEDIRDFTGDYPQNDDITVVAIKEKLMADDVLFGIRKKLLDMVDIEGLSVAEACQRMKVSPSTYYRYRRRLAEMGERGLQNKLLRREHEIKRVSIEQRKRLLSIIKQNPRYGAKRIGDIFNQELEEKDRLRSALIYDELKRMRLNTYEKRLEYLRRNRFIDEDQYQQMLLSPASGKRTGGEDLFSTGEDAAFTGKPALRDGGAEEIPLPETGEGAPGEIPVAGTGKRDKDFRLPPIREEPAARRISVPRSPDSHPLSLSRFDINDSGEGEDESIESQLSRVLGEESEAGRSIKIKLDEQAGGAVVLKIIGHLDSSSAGELETVLESIYEYGTRKIIVDLREVSYISSGGWGIFTGRVKILREGEGDVVLAGMSPEVFDIYELLGFEDIIMHFQRVEEAVKFISLPFEERQASLEKASRARAKDKVIEYSLSSEVPAGEEGDEKQSAWVPLNIEAGTVGKEGEITVLNLEGVIDTVSCMNLRTVMDDLVDKGSVKLLVDMSRVEYVSSAGWGVFASSIDEVRERGGDLKIFGMDPEVDSIFHLLGFDVIMRSFSIMSEAIEDFQRPSVLQGDIQSAPPPVEVEAAVPPEPVAPAGHEGSGKLLDMRLEVSSAESSGKESIVIYVRGAVDAATTEEFENYLRESRRKKPRYLVIDLEQVVYISSSGWGVLIKNMQEFSAGEGKIALSGMSPVIFKIFRDLGFEPLIPHYLTVQKALQELAAPPPEMETGAKAEGSGREKIDLPAGGALKDKSRAGIRKEKRAPTRGGKRGADKAPSGITGRPGDPEVEKIGVVPLEATPPEKTDDLMVAVDLNQLSGSKEKKDQMIRDMGWASYGEKLVRRNREKKKNGKK